MKKSYVCYLNELSGNRMDVLEEIITTKFHQFRKFYKSVANYSSDIAHISYRFSHDDSLDIDITVDPEVNPKEFAAKICDDTDKKYFIGVKTDKHAVMMSITPRE